MGIVTTDTLTNDGVQKVTFVSEVCMILDLNKVAMVKSRLNEKGVSITDTIVFK